MHQDNLESHLQGMDLRDLFKILLRGSTEFNVDVLNTVREELERRGIVLDTVTDQFEIRINDNLLETENLEHAGQFIADEMSIWDTLSINNFLQEHLTIQKGSDFWIFRYIDADDGHFTFRLDDPERVKTALRKFLLLEDWEPAEENQFTFEDWEIIFNTTSRFYIEGLTANLKEAEIPYMLEPVRVGSVDPLFVSPTVQERQTLLIPREYLDEYKELMSAQEQQKTELLAQLEELEKAENLEGQLAVHRQLERVTPIDSYIFYNKGCVLFELRRFEEAVEAVLFSINLDLELGQLSNAYKSMKLLEEILAETPKNKEVLHCLAHLESQRDNLDTARTYYQRILGIDENDEVAHLNLGYLYYESSQMESLAMRHFNKYLEVAENEEEKKSSKIY